MSEEATNFSKLLTEKQPIKILVYADGKIVDDDFEGFGIGQMRQLIDAHQPSSAFITIELKNRVPAPNTPVVRLPELLQETYSQIWFFGFRQLTKEEQNTPENPDNPSEFSQEELDKLADWMKEGGVLMAGDHSETDPRNPSEDHETFLARGRALGEKVPRAGQLRKWIGPPTIEPLDSRNSQVQIFGDSLDDQSLEKDNIPQILILETFNPVTGEPVFLGRPHHIFIDDKGRPIRVFPDHIHEGEVVIPSVAELEKWPKGDVIAPYPVAHGIDKRNGKKYILLALYNGDRASVGRIAAESTWHHYLNVNLTEFKKGVGVEDTVFDEVGQFYRNLAIWLSPFKVRRAMAFYTFYRLAHDPQVVDEINGDILNIGRIARRVLSQDTSPCEIDELLQTTVTVELRQQYENLYFPKASIAASPLPSQELLLGAIVKLYSQKLPGILNSALSDDEKIESLEALTREGFKQAQDTHIERLTQVFAMAQSLV